MTLEELQSVSEMNTEAEMLDKLSTNTIDSSLIPIWLELNNMSLDRMYTDTHLSKVCGVPKVEGSEVEPYKKLALLWGLSLLDTLPEDNDSFVLGKYAKLRNTLLSSKYADKIKSGRLKVDDTGWDNITGTEVKDMIKSDIESLLGNDNDVCDKELDEYDSSIQFATDRIMAVYEKMFAPGFRLAKPKGILVREGLLYLDGELRPQIKQDSQLTQFYGVLNNTSKYNYTEVKSLFNFKNVKEGVSYFPLLMLALSKGMYLPTKSVDKLSRYNGTGWKPYSKYIKKQIAYLLNAIVEQQGSDTNISSIAESLTNCILLVDFDTSICLKCKVANLEGVSKEHIEQSISGGLFFKRGTVQLFKEHPEVSTKDITIVFDMDNFSKYPLFAFQALDVLNKEGIKPSWSNVILGKDMSDDVYSHDFTDDHFATNIIAGSGSGKGVMTLNILSSALSDGIPVFYSDCKPDMAETIHKLGGNTKTYAYDAIIPKWGSPYETAWDSTVPSYVKNCLGSGFTCYGAISYVKSVQLNLLIAHLRNPVVMSKYGLSKEDLGGDRCLFIWDEFLAVNGYLETVIETFENDLSMLESKEKKESDLYIYYKKLKMWIQKVTNSLSNFYVADGRVADVNLVTIFQEVNGASVDKFKKTMLFKTALKNQNGACKLLGRGVSTGYEGTLGIKGTPEFDLIEQERYFGYTTTRQCKEVGNIEVFKPYLILNSTDEDAKCMRTIRNIQGIDNIIGPVGSAEPRVGLKGYVESLLGSNIESQLGKSYIVAQNALDIVNYGGTVDDFLYDFSIDGFKTIDDYMGNIGSSTPIKSSADGGDDVGFAPDLDEENNANSFEDSTNASNFADSVLSDEPQQNQEYGNQEGYNYDELNSYNEPSVIYNSPEEIYIEPEVDASNNTEYTALSAPLTGNDAKTNELLQSLINSIESLKQENIYLRNQLEKEKTVGQNMMNDDKYQNYLEDSKREYANKEIPQEQIRSSERTVNFLGHQFKFDTYNGFLNIGNVFKRREGIEENSQYFVNVGEVMYQDIIKQFGGASRITEFMVISCNLIINGYGYTPTLREDVIKSLPLDVRRQVSQGMYAWLFNFKHLKDFSNLAMFGIDDEQLMYSKIRVDLKKGYDFEPKHLFRVCPNLNYLVIGEDTLTRQNLNALDNKFHVVKRQTEIANAVESKCANFTRDRWTSVQDIYRNKELGVFKKTLAMTGMGAVTAASGLATAGIKLGRGLAGIINTTRQGR